MSESFRLWAWNIRQGGGSRANQIASVCAAQRADVVVLSEFRNNDAGDLIRTKLLLAGYRCQVVTDADARINSVLIASKEAGSSQLFHDLSYDYPYGVARLDLEACSVYGLYLPHKKKHRLFDLLEDDVKRRDRPAILAGDWNTGINGVDQKGNSFWYSDRLEDFERIGLRDCYRAVHPDARDYSWWSPGGNGYRYDHIWASETLVAQVEDCGFDHEQRESGLSDHSPMFLRLPTG